MLYRSILAKMEEDGKIDKRDLARATGTSTSMIEAMLEEMIRLGYLKLEEFSTASCESCCQDCKPRGGCSGCGFSAQGLGKQIWTITPKGQRLLSGSAAHNNRK